MSGLKVLKLCLLAAPHQYKADGLVFVGINLTIRLAALESNDFFLISEVRVRLIVFIIWGWETIKRKMGDE